MRILFFPHPYHGLYKAIEHELIEQGHEVTTIVDPCVYSYLWKREKVPLRVEIRKRIVERLHLIEKYWKKRIRKDERLNKKYDVFFAIQGLSFTPVILEHLRLFNPNIKSSLYVWDSNRLHDFFRNIQYFEKVYSFDWYDVTHDETNKVKFLPFFWPKNLTDLDAAVLKYEISSIGSCHDGRLGIFKKCSEQFEREGISHFLKLYVPDKRPLTLRNLLYLYRHQSKPEDEKFETFLLSKNLRSYSFTTHQLVPLEDTTRIMAQSRAILDTDRELQYGTTPRLIWALAENKHIFTTNIRVKEFPFYSPEYIHFIDRQNPYVDITQIRDGKRVNSRDKVMHLRIDNWVRNFI